MRALHPAWLPPLKKGGVGGISRPTHTHNAQKSLLTPPLSQPLQALMLPYKPKLKPLARELRNAATPAEQCLWAKLRRKQLAGLQFYRQKPLAGHIVDFYCPAAHLVIELDGSQHQMQDKLAYDQLRTGVLQAMGLTVLRFDNRQVLLELAAVLTVIESAVGGARG